MTEKEKTVDANAINASENAKKKDKEKKKKAGIVIGIVGLSVAAAIAAAAGAKACAPNERNYTVTYLTDDEVQNFQGGSFSVKEGTSIGDLKRQLAPLDGYEVEGFFRDPDCTLEFRDDEKVNDDTKIYIEYKEIEITLIFHNESNPSDNSFENMNVMYFDNFSEKVMPTPENYSTYEGNYTFKCWKTLDGKVVDLKSMTSGKDLLAIDADGEIDLYAEFDFEAVKTYSLNFDSSKVKITKDGAELTPQDRVRADDELIVEGVEVETDWVYTISGVTGLEVIEGTTYRITGDVEVIIGEVEHRYLTFTLKDDQTYEVKGMKEGSTETNIVVPEKHYDGKAITGIGERAFYNCSKLTNITIGKNVTNIGERAFSGCSKLTSVTYKGTADNWVNNQFSKGFAYAFDLTIGDTLLTEYTFTGDMPEYALQYVKSLTSVIVSGSSTNIGDYAFRECSGLTSVTIGKNVTSIGSFAFMDCSKLTSVTIGENVTSVGNYAFDGCSEITEVNYTGIIDHWASINFGYFTANPIYYAKKLKINGEELSENITIDVPINAYVFYNCGNIKNITLGENCTSVGERAFFGCSGLTSVTIGENVTSIRNDVFRDCNKLTNVTYKGTTEEWMRNQLSSGFYSSFNLTIGDKLLTEYTFTGDVPEHALQYVKSLTSVTFGEGCTNIGQYAFYYCSGLTNIIVRDNVTSIGNWAFYNCSILKKVYYKGNEEGWKTLKSNIGSSNTPLTSTSTHIYFYEQTNPYDANPDAADGKYWHYEGDDTTTPVVWAKENQ